MNHTRTIIVDAPPGTSCPVIAAVKDSDFCLLVTEPTPFGLHDLTLAVAVLKKLEISFGVIINRHDKGNQNTAKYCKSHGIPVLMKLPFKRSIASVYAQGIPIVEAFPEYHKLFHGLFENIQQQMEIPCT
jgi:MinD superfamily P-loop ATPase